MVRRETISHLVQISCSIVYIKAHQLTSFTNLTLNLGLNLSTSFNTKYGNYNFKSGGVSWYRQSRLTVWGNRSFNRVSIFERRPQTSLNKIPINRYSNYYNSGLIDEGIRYGSLAFKGIFLKGKSYRLIFL